MSKTEPAAWYRKRVRHFCSRACANKHQAKLAEEVRGGPVDRKAYEKGYWAKPENAARRRADTRVAVRRRMEALGDSYKKMVLARCRGRAKEKGIPCTISIADFEIPSHCPVLGVPLQVGVGQGGQPFSPSLDRIDSSKGYEPGNVMVISKRANSMKSDATVEEVEMLLAWMKRAQPLQAGKVPE